LCQARLRILRGSITKLCGILRAAGSRMQCSCYGGGHSQQWWVRDGLANESHETRQLKGRRVEFLLGLRARKRSAEVAADAAVG
jgi:hypothetical protein